MKIKKRLISYEKEIKLRRNLKRKMKPAISDGSMVPMNVYSMIVSYDG